MRKELDRRPRSPPKSFDKKETDEKKQDKLPAADKPAEARAEPRKKTEQELEDELLASSDSEKGFDDDDTFKVTLDEKELDFLDDDEEESENEGRFKSKPATSSQPKKPMATSSFKSSYASKNFDKPKSFNSNEKHYARHDHRRRDDSKREKKISPKRTPERKQKKSPEARKSPAKETVAPSRVIVLKEKPESTVKSDSKKKKLPFKSTFKQVDAPIIDKKKGKYRRRGRENQNSCRTYRLDEGAKKDERVRLVRVSVINKTGELCR